MPCVDLKYLLQGHPCVAVTRVVQFRCYCAAVATVMLTEFTYEAVVA